MRDCREYSFVMYVPVRHVDVMVSGVEAAADEDGHKWLPIAAH